MTESGPSILLDTHIWIWLVNGDNRLKSGSFLKKIHQSSESFGLKVSVMSVWEVGMLETKGRIELPYNVLEWTQKALRAPGVSLLPLTPEIALESTRLGSDFHGDPVDRILFASAKSLGAILATQDEGILGYARKHAVKTLEP